MATTRWTLTRCTGCPSNFGLLSNLNASWTARGPRKWPAFFRGWTMGASMGLVYSRINLPWKSSKHGDIYHTWILWVEKEVSLTFRQTNIANWISTILMVIYQEKGQILHGYVCLRYSIYQTGNWPKCLKQILLVKNFQFHSEQIEFVKLRDSENRNVLNHWGLVVWGPR